MIVKRVVVGNWKANCYLVGSETTRQGLIIDPGDDEKEILAAVKETALEIRYLVATHGHVDHIGVIGYLKKALNAPVAIHSQDAGSLEGKSPFSWCRTLGPPVQADRFLVEGDYITVADLEFTVITTPGHTEGGICLYGEGALFTGDTLFRHAIGSVGYDSSSRSRLMSSIYEKLLTLPPATVIYPGHGSPTSIAEEKAWNPDLNRRY